MLTKNAVSKNKMTTCSTTYLHSSQTLFTTFDQLESHITRISSPYRKEGRQNRVMKLVSTLLLEDHISLLNIMNWFLLRISPLHCQTESTERRLRLISY